MEIETKTVSTCKIKGIKVDGNHALLKACKYFIMLDWNGYAVRVVHAQRILSGDFHLSYYNPCDKGGLSLFGVDVYDNVICGMAYFENEPGGPVMFVSPATTANPWSYQ